MTIQQLASPGAKNSIAATLSNATERGGSASRSSFASSLRDSIDKAADRGHSADEEVRTAPVKKRSHKNEKSHEENAPENAGPGNQHASPPSSGPAAIARAGQTDGAAMKPEQTAEAGQGADADAESQSFAPLLDPAVTQPGMSGQGTETAIYSWNLQHLTGILRDGSVSVQNNMTRNGNGLPASGKELPQSLLTMETGINSPFDPDGAGDLDMSAMPGFSETSLLTDMALLKTGGEQPGQSAAHNLSGPLLSASTAGRDSRGLGAETTATTENPQLYSSAEMGSDAWLDDFGTKIQWLQNMKHASADLTLHPAELGSIEIRIVTEDNTTKVTIVTQTGVARDIIEATLPRLREMLASQGMELEQGSVSQQTAEDRRQGRSAHHDDSRHDSDDVLTEVGGGQQSRLLAAGQIDHYV